MKKHLKNVLLLFCIIGNVYALGQQIPELNWDKNERSDWINVKKDLSIAAVGNGINDDTKAIQRALEKIDTDHKDIRQKTSAIYLPEGTYIITSTLELGSKIGVSIIGSGSKTRIVWKGAKGGIMFRSNGNNYSRMIGIEWDGNNLASAAILHSNKNINRFETRIRHEHQSFRNLEYGILGMLPAKGSSSAGSGLATAETMVLNCKFEAVSYPISLNDFNYYNWIIDGCLFVRAKIAVNAPYGTFFIRNCRFEKSTESDFLLGVYPNGYTIRRCVSLGSHQFIKNRGGFYLPCPLVVENCYVQNWTAAAPIWLTARGPSFIVDCKFFKQGYNTAPVQVLKPLGQGYNVISKDGRIHRLVTSGNSVNGYIKKDIIDDFGRAGGVDFVDVPSGKIAPATIDSATPFFKTTLHSSASKPDAHVINIFDEIPGNINPETQDVSQYIQKAIDKALKRGKGTVVYFPVGRYRVAKTVGVEGNDIVLQGSGFNTVFVWAGDPKLPMLKMDNLNNVLFEQFRFDYLQVPQTYVLQYRNAGLRKTLVVFDGVYHNHNPDRQKKNLDISDALFETLGKQSFVFMKHVEFSMHVKDCAGSNFLVDNFINYYQTVLKLSGKSSNKNQWFNMLTAVVIASSSSPEIAIEDNNSITITDMYNESGRNHIYLKGKKNDRSSGRVTIQGVKQDFLMNQDYDTLLYSDNYRGVLFYGPQNFYNNVKQQKIIIQNGALKVLFAGVNNNDTMPFTIKGSGKISFNQSIRNIKNNDRDQIINNSSITESEILNYQNALDDIRAAGKLDLNVKYENYLQNFLQQPVKKNG